MHLYTATSSLTTYFLCLEDERTIANKLAREEKRAKEGEDEPEEVSALKEDPTKPVSSAAITIAKSFGRILMSNLTRPSSTAMSQARAPKLTLNFRQRRRQS